MPWVKTLYLKGVLLAPVARRSSSAPLRRAVTSSWSAPIDRSTCHAGKVRMIELRFFWGLIVEIELPLAQYFSAAYSVFDAMRIGTSGSAPFQRVKKSW